MDSQNKDVFGDLPQALVEELLGKCQDVGKTLSSSFKDIQEKKDKHRSDLTKSSLLKRDTDFSIQTPPTTCAIDGSYAKEELLSVDILAAAALAMEGLTPPSEKRYWGEPHHIAYIKGEIHNPESATILRGLMMCMEQKLASQAPHDVVYIDGSLSTPFIFFNQSLNKAEESARNKVLEVSKALFSAFPEGIAAYKKVICNTRTDKLWIGLPKYTTRREVGKKLNWDPVYDDKALLTLVLEPGEVTLPIDIEKPEQPWHLTYAPCQSDIEAVKGALNTLKVMYYKPNSWTPALRIEMGASAASNKYQIGMVLQSLKFQCSTPGIFEPYPLFMADKMVKSLSRGLPTFRQVVTRQMAEEYSGDVGEIFFSMHGYRTEQHK